MNWFLTNPIKVVACVFALILALMTAFTVKDGTVVVIDTLGKYSDDERTAGVHFKAPFFQNATTMNVKMHAAHYAGKQDLEDGEGMINKPAIVVMDSKNLPIGIELTLQYTPNGTEMSTLLRNVGKGYFEKMINPTVRDNVRDVVADYEAEEIATKRSIIGANIKAMLLESFKANAFITVNDVALRNILLPPLVKDKILKVQEAKQEEQRLEMVERQATVDKRIAIINAEKEEQQIVIAARAEAESVTLRATAQAKANRKVAASLTDLLVKQNQIERWSGVLPTTILGGQDVMLNMGGK